MWRTKRKVSARTPKWKTKRTVVSLSRKKPRRYQRGAYELKARDDLDTMRILAAQGYEPANTASFHAQQYAEKMIKDTFSLFDLPVPLEHNITVLLTILNEDAHVEIPEDIMFYAATIESIYLSARYPDEETGEVVQISPESAENACNYSLLISDWIYEIRNDIDEGLTSRRRPRDTCPSGCRTRRCRHRPCR